MSTSARLSVSAALAACVLATLAASAPPARARGPLIRVPGDFLSIQAAIDDAPSGSRILVKKGVYEETLTLTDRTDLKIIGRGKPVIDGGGATAVSFVRCSLMTLTGFVVRDADVGVRIDDSSRVSVVRCTIEDSTVNGIEGNGSDTLLVNRCKVTDTGTAAVVLGLNSAVDDSLVTRTRVQRSGRGGIVFGGKGNRAVRNRVEDADRHGFETRLVVASNDNEFLRNRVSGGGAGIRIHGNLNRVTRNTCTGNVEAGVELENDATNTTVSRQVVLKAQTVGIVVEGSANALSRCRVPRPGTSGVSVSGDGNTIDRTTVVRAGADGFLVSGSGNVFTRNKAIRSTGFGLSDLVGPDENTYAPSNKFGETQIGP